MNLFIDNKSGAPIYDQIYTQIKALIISGELNPDTSDDYLMAALQKFQDTCESYVG